MALTGLATKLSSKLVNTSCRLAGGTCSIVALTNTKSVGNNVLATTAVNAAKNVPTIYIIMTGLTNTSLPLRCWLIAAITKTNTNTGATAFNAPTNKVPSKPKAMPILGASQPINTPNIKPIIISGTSPIRWYIAINERITPPLLKLITGFIQQTSLMKAESYQYYTYQYHNKRGMVAFFGIFAYCNKKGAPF